MHYCPKCRSEYQDWVQVCPDCKTALTDKLPDKPPAQTPKARPDKIVTIATFGFPEQARLIQAELKTKGIWSFIGNENMNRIYPNTTGGVNLQVRESDAERALRIVKKVH
jgi:hypothetical protein